MATFAEVPWIAKHIELYRTDPEKAHMWDSAEAGGEGTALLLAATRQPSSSSADHWNPFCSSPGMPHLQCDSFVKGDEI